MKTCKTCNKRRRDSSFPPDKRTSDGLSKRCNTCAAKADKAYKEKQKEYNAAFRANNPDYDRTWRKQNLGYAAFQTALHQQETPDCLTEEQKEELLTIYAKAAIWTQQTGTAYEVDHVVPRVGLDEDGNHVVSGLHVPNNLQIIPAELNRRKGIAVLEDCLN